jgi:PAS domain S-box-containing protein
MPDQPVTPINEHSPENNNQKEDSRLSEQFLNSLLDSQTNFLIRFDTNGDFTFANKSFLKKLGYKKSEVVGKHFSLVTIPEELEMCSKAFVNCIGHPGKVIPLTHKKIDKSGHLHDTEWEFVSVANDEGAVIAIQGIGQDITQKLINEKEKKATAKKLDNFIESINDYFFMLDSEWKFLRVNAAFEKITQKSRKELLGSVIWEMFPVIAGTAFETGYRKAVAQNKSIQFTAHVASANMWFNTTAYPSAEGLTVFMKNITEEKRAQEEVIWAKNSLEALINNTEDQIWSVDSETRYVYMNKAYRLQILQLTGSEPKPGDYSYLHPGYSPEVIAQWGQYYARALAGERYTIVSESIDLLTQKLLSFEISFNPIYKVKGDVTGIGCFARNITQWLETEKAIVDQNERLRHIASLTSHELRRPVASMLGLINLMDRSNFFNPDNKEIIEHLLTVGNEIDDVIRLIVDKTFMGDQSKEKYQAP